MRSPRPNVLTDPVAPTLLRLAAPMLLGIASIVLFQVVDTYFVGKLGVLPLAAMSYTFPVTLVVFSVAMGLSVGATAVIARAIGGGDRDEVRKLTTHALLLSVGAVTTISLLGLVSMDWIFGRLGVDHVTLPLVRQYMVPWFLGIGFLVVPMVGNGAIRASGDTLSPMLIMLVAGVVNLVLDPMFIFGFGPIPRLELQGAAIATALSWLVTLVCGLWVLAVRERMLDFGRPRIADVLASWRRILRIGLPAAGTNVLIPLSTGILLRMVAEYGHDAVAAFGVATRIESLALIGVNALSVAVTPFAGQNFGARNQTRISQALTFVVRASLVWGTGVAVLLVVFGTAVAAWFSDAPSVTHLAGQYLSWVPLSYGSLGIAMIVSTLFNALDAPAHSAAVIITRLFALAVPFAYAGSLFFGIQGIFMGISAANLLIGLLTAVFGTSYVARLSFADESPAELAVPSSS